MAIDLEAIKRKIQQISGNNKGAFWRPKAGEFLVRILPWKDLDKDGTIFHERYFYYNIGVKSGILAPKQFGKADPVQELIDKLRQENTEDSSKTAKNLYPNMRAYAAVVVRGEEDKGVRIWSFGKDVYERLLSFYLDEDVAEITQDITSIENGLDLKVKLEQQKGKKYLTTKVDPKLKASKLSKDPAQVKEWLAKMPKVDEHIPELKSYEEIEKLLNDWLNADTFNKDDLETSSEPSQKVSTDTVSKASNNIDDIMKELEDD